MSNVTMIRVPKLLNIDEVAKLVGLSKSGLDKARKRGELAEPVVLGGRNGWTPADVQKYFDDKLAERAARQAARDEARRKLGR